MTDQLTIINSPWGGVSRQAATDRHPNQVQEADNTLLSVSSGLSKRPGSYSIAAIDRHFTLAGATWTAATRTLTETNAFTNYTFTTGDIVFLRTGTGIRSGPYEIESKTDASNIVLRESISSTDLATGDIVSGLESGANYRIHTIDRDESERYIVIYGKSVLRVFDTQGREQNVSSTQDAWEYLVADNTRRANGAQPEDLRMVTVADHTIINNRNVFPQLVGTDRFNTDPTSPHADFEALLAASPGNGTYHRTKASSTGRPAGYYLHQTGNQTKAQILLAKVGLPFTNHEYWHDPSRNPASIDITFREADRYDVNGANWTEATKTLTAGTAKFANYTHQAGDTIHIVAGTGVTVGTYTISSKTSSTEIVLATSISTGAVDLNNNDIKSGFNDTTVTVTHNVADGFYNGKTMADVAQKFEDSLSSSLPGATWDFRDDETGAFAIGQFVITSPYGGAGSIVFHPDSNLSGDYQLRQLEPFWGNRSWRLDGTGDPLQQTLDEFDRFTRVAAPGQKLAKPLATTMPVRLVRESIDTTDDNGGYVPSSWHLSLNTWKDRLSGDETSNPAPGIFDTDIPEGISDITFFANRLVMSREENVIFSQAGDFFNLFIDDVTNLIDSDPIDIQVSSSRVTKIDSMVPFRRGLVAITKADKQFEVSSSLAPTPTTTSFIPTTSYNSIIGLDPAEMGNLMYFGSEAGDIGVIYEYEFRDEVETSVAQDITKHVEGYIPASIKRIAASPNNSAVAVIGDRTDKIYVYRAHWQGIEKVQSAWSRFDYDGDTILDIGILRNDIYILSESDDGFFLDRMPINVENPSVSKGTWYGAVVENLDYTDFTGISDGSFRATIDAQTLDVTGCDFTSATDLDGIASVIQTRLQATFAGSPTVRIDSSRFVITSSTTGASSQVSGISQHSSMAGTDLATSALLGTPGEAFSSTMPYRELLDRKVTATGTYSIATNETTWDYGYGDSSIDTVVLGRDFGGRSGNWITVTRVDATSVKVTGKFDAGPCVLGRSYTMNAKLSKLYRRASDGSAILDGTYRIREVITTHRDTANYTVTCRHSGSIGRSKQFEPSRVNVSNVNQVVIESEGQMITTGAGISDQMEITITNDTPTPSIIANITVSAEHDFRSP